MATGAGLEVERLWGGLDGSDLEMGSRRIVMLARRSGEPFGSERRLRDMHVRPLAALVATTAVLAAGCGQAAGGRRQLAAAAAVRSRRTCTISGVLLATTSAHPNGGSPQSGVKIGIFTRPFSTAGPLMADPPSPIATARTDADGAFSHRGSRIAAALLRLGARRPRVCARALGAAGRGRAARHLHGLPDPALILSGRGRRSTRPRPSAATVAAGSSQRHAVIAPAAAATADMTHTAS